MARLQKKDLFTGKLLATAIRTAIALLLLHEIPWPSSRFLVANAYSIGDVDPRALRGVWRLTSLDEDGLPFERRQNKMFPSPTEVITDPKMIWKLRGFLPMKEFTTYPKKIKSLEEKNDGEAVKAPRQNTEIFIKLKDDFTFEQCSSLRFSDGDAGEDESFEEQLALEVSKRERESFAWKGTWDFVDGKLILAADRPEKKPFSAVNDDSDEKSSDGDTILVGRVSVQENESLTDNPVMEQREMMSDPTLSGQSQAEGEESSNNSNQKTPASQPARSSRSIDVHLSVPKGKIKTGKFMYPKHHPSFFEQPIVRPQHMGSFELRQILGDYNAKLTNDDDDDELVELFRKKDLVGKRFYLSTFPIPKYKRKGRESWSTKEQKWIHDVFETAQEKQEEAAKPGNNMQVMAVELFANNTFSTLYGLGNSTTLRGKWSIVGKKRDQLWMMVYRFGFGRSVSGSTFSEGTSLTQNDEKCYWGQMTEVEDPNQDSIEVDPAQWGGKKIEVEGAIMVGWGLEPCSIARFKMIEMDDDMLEEDDDDEDEDEDEEDEIDVDVDMNNTASLDELLENDSGAEDGSDPFDAPGSFE